MPLCEYQCDACGARFERIQKFSDPPIAACPTCGGTVKKLVSSPAFQFKGSGWYITDYARKSGGGEKDKSKGGDESKPDSGAKADTKSGDTAAKSADKPSDKPAPGAKDD
jgi:putative FmdB family regulatory protein